MQALMNTMYKTAGLPQNADIDFESFAKIFASDEYESTLKKATLGIEGKETLRKIVFLKVVFSNCTEYIIKKRLSISYNMFKTLVNDILNTLEILSSRLDKL